MTETPIDQAIAETEAWLDALDQERDRVLVLLAQLKGVRLDAPVLLRRRPARDLPPGIKAVMAKARIPRQRTAREA